VWKQSYMRDMYLVRTTHSKWWYQRLKNLLILAQTIGY
jgi:hypothetical protein